MTFLCHAYAVSSLLAQGTTTITPTTGIGNLGTTVTTRGHTVQITDGTRYGESLFHSFKQFDVGQGDTAQFLNTSSSAHTSNILSRVTGGNPSSIFGTIDTMSYPGANLFLMNPAGIVFGPNATLNVGGSVAFTTADYLRLAKADGSNAGIFHADMTATSLLTNAPIAAFGFLGSNPAAIAVHGSTLTVEPGQSLSLIGGNITVGSSSATNGNVQQATLSAQGGQINIAGVASPGEILTRTWDRSPNINGQSFRELGEIHISQGSNIDTSGKAGGGTILIRGGRLVIDESTISTNTGDITLNATSIEMTNGAHIATVTKSSANAGHIALKASEDITLGLAVVESISDASSGNAGNIMLHSTQGNINLSDFSLVTSQANNKNSGNTGRIKIDAPHGDITLDSAFVFTSAQGKGTLGGIQITANNLFLLNEASIVGNNFTAQVAGNIDITVEGRLKLTGNSTIETATPGSANAADLIIRSRDILITEKSNLVASTTSSGDAGRISLSADHLQFTDGGNLSSRSFVATGTEEIPSGRGGIISIKGFKNPGVSVAIDGAGSGIFTDTQGIGGAGNIAVDANSVTLTNGGEISAKTTGSTSTATGGSITVNATDHVTLTGSSTSITASTNGPGDAGNILVKSNDIAVSGGATITASSTGSGKAGIVTIQGTQGPANSFLIDGFNSGVFTKTTKTGAGGDITVSSNSIRMQNEGRISGETSGTDVAATGGKIRIDGGQIRIENGALVTSSSTGVATGGNIALTAGQSVTIQDGASISASSTGSGNAGNITLNAGQQLDVRDSPKAITTDAAKASGGNIDIRAIDHIRFANSQISASVGADRGNGGNITIDPKTVVLQNAQILANAQQGNGGNITITTPLFLQDQTSLVDASSQFGVNGTVTVQSPTSNLSGTVKQLTSKPNETQALLQSRCVALAGGEQSTFIVAGRDALPSEPGGWLSSPLSMDHLRGHDAEHAAGPTARSVGPPGSPAMTASAGETQVLSLRRLTPPGFLVRTFGSDGVTGCRS